MDHEAIRELMRSPLDDPRPQLPLWVLAVALFAVAVVGGGLAGYLVRGDEPATAAPSSSTTTVAAEVHGLPDGYVALDEHRGLRADWLFVREGTIYVAVSSAVRSDTVPATSWPVGQDLVLGSTRRALGAWTLRLTDGTAVPFARERFDPDAPGIVTVEFPGAGVSPEDVEGLELRPLVGSGLRTDESQMVVESLPVVLGAGEMRVPASERVEEVGTETALRSDESWLSIDTFEVEWDYGVVGWHLEGVPDVGAMVTFLVTMESDDVVTDERRVLVSANAMPDFFLQRPHSPDSPARAGTTYLLRRQRTGLDRYPVTSLRVEWTVSWARYGDEVIEIPTDSLFRG